jgi:hypothetical protein
MSKVVTQLLKFTSRLALAIWFVGALGLGAALIALHTPLALSAVDTSRPSASGSALGREQESLTNEPQTAGWNATHFIANGCGCSSDVARHLLARGRLPELASELVVFIGTPEFETEAFHALGFRTSTVAVAELAQRFGVEAAPLMHLQAPDGRRAYTGGYYETMARTEARDASIIRLAMAGESPDALPSWGCALSDELREAQDPLGIKKIR